MRKTIVLGAILIGLQIPLLAYVFLFVGNVAEPAGVVGASAAVVNTPVGSETFAGVSDAFLIRVQQ